MESRARVGLVLPALLVFAVAPIARAEERVEAAAEAWDATRTWAVVVGVLEWKNPGFAPFSKANRKDQELYDVLLKRGVPRQQATLLLDEAATRAAMLNAVRDAARKADERSTLVFYYAGHGVRRENHYYLANYDAGDEPEGTCVPISEIAAILKREFRGRRVLFFADCCHSGGLREAAAAVAATKRQAVIVTSVSPEGISTGNWTFTETLLDGLTGRFTVDRDADGAVTFQEMAEDVGAAMKYVERQPYGFANFGVPRGLRMASAGKRQPLPDDAKYRVGQFVSARDATGWVTGRVLGKDAGQWRVELQAYSTRPVLRVSDEDIDEAVEPWPSRSETSDAAVAEVPVKPGTELLVEWGRQMWPARVVAIDAPQDRYRIHYLGWPDSDDEWVPPQRMVALEAPLEPSDALVQWGQAWWPARVLVEKKGRTKVHFVGWSDHWDEWVTPNRIRKGAAAAPKAEPSTPSN